MNPTPARRGHADQSREARSALSREELAAELAGKAQRVSELEARLARLEAELTGRERSAEEARASEERHRVLLEVSPQILWMADTAGHLTYASEHLLAYCARPSEAMLGDGWMDIVHREDRTRIAEAFRTAAVSGGEIETEIRFRRADGEFRWFLARARPLRDSSARVFAFAGVSLEIHERQQVEQRLRESEARYRCAILATADLLWTNNAEGQMVGEQPGWGRFTGQTFAEYQGYGWARAVHPDDAQPTIEAWKEAVAGRSKFVFEHRLRRHDGEWRHCAIRALPVLNDDGSIREWVGAHTDITAQKRAEAALRESETMLRSVFENTVLPIFLWEGDLYIDANEAGVALLGYPREDFRRGRVNERRITAPGFAEIDARMHDCIVRDGLTPPFTKEYLGRNGQRVPVEVVATVIGNSRTRGISFVTDISQRQRAEAELLAKERHLRLALESTGLGTWESRVGFECTDWSPRMREITGAPADLTASRGWFTQRLTAEDVFRFVQAMERAANPAIGKFSLELQLSRPDGEVRWVQMTGRGVFDRTAAGEPACERVIGTVLDITELKRAEKHRQEALAAAESANAAKDEFLAKLSHELRTPLTPVLMSVSWMLSELPTDAEQRADLEMIRRNVELEAHLIDDMLDVTRIVNGKLILKSAPCDLHDSVRHAREVCAGALAARRIRVELRLTARRSRICGDAARLQQVFWNLFNNSAKFAPEGGVIEVWSENMPGGELRICVRDQGVGIDPQHLPQLFDAFAQGEPSVTRRFGGLGLGLTICRGILEMHGGRIWAESAGLGKGATFTVELPTIAEEAR